MMIPFTRIPPRDLCILRLSAIGDVTHVVPVVRTIQSSWPDTRITWILGKLENTLVGDIPGIEFIVFDKSRAWRAQIDLRRRLANREFDILLDMQPSLRANLASCAVRSPVKLGFDHQRAKDFQWLFTNQQVTARPHQHVLDGFFEFLEALGLKQRVLRWDIPIPEEARQFAERVAPGNKPIMALNPCANPRLRNWRTWSPEGYAAVADHAAHRHGLEVVLTGGPATRELEFGDRICRLCRMRPLNLIGKTSLKSLLALLRRATVLVAPDTGPAHMATAVGTPVIGLYATTNPERACPYLSRQWVVNKYPEALFAEYGRTVEQAPWGKRVRSPEAMNRITVGDVTAKLDALMAAQAGGPR